MSEPPTEPEAEAVPGFIAEELRAELPGLRLDWVAVAAGRRASTPAAKQRLRQLSSRYRGASVVAMRTGPIAHAYRALFRQVGLDPDTTRPPAEEAAVQRLLHGGFRSRDLLDDALLIALIETGVPVWAIDAEFVAAGGLGIRTTVVGERLGCGDRATPLPQRRLVVADARCVHALLFGDVVPDHRVRTRTERAVLFAIGAPGVPAIHSEEALWHCLELLGSRC